MSALETIEQLYREAVTELDRLASPDPENSRLILTVLYEHHIELARRGDPLAAAHFEDKARALLRDLQG